MQCSLLSYTYKFYLENQCRASRNAGLRYLAITHFGRDVYLPLISYVHLLQSDNPALNEVAQSASQWRTTPTAVELLAVDSPTGIVSNDNATT